MGVLPVVGNRHVHLAQVDTCRVFCAFLFQGKFLLFWQAFPNLIRRQGFVLCACPMDHHRLGASQMSLCRTVRQKHTSVRV